jgi:hypothetical protein
MTREDSNACNYTHKLYVKQLDRFPTHFVSIEHKAVTSIARHAQVVEIRHDAS